MRINHEIIRPVISSLIPISYEAFDSPVQFLISVFCLSLIIISRPHLRESTLYSCLNFMELLARNRCHIWSLSHSNGIQTHNHLVRKGTLNHSAKKMASLAKWLSLRLRIMWYWIRIPLLSLKRFYVIYLLYSLS